MSYPPGVAYMDGEYVPMDQAKISVLDWGFLRSDATYDVVHVWKGRFFRLDAHIDRFMNSVSQLRLKLPVSRAELEQILAQCVARSGHDDAYVEMILTRGVSPVFSRDPRDAENRLICFAIPFGWILPPDKWEQGLSVAISDIRKIPPHSVDPKVKNYHWLDFVMGLYEAYEKGAVTVLLKDEAGDLAEGPGYNIFSVKDGEVVTPAAGVLEGITRRSALEIAGELGINAMMRPMSVAELYAADEIFATSTAGGIMPVTKLDKRIVGSGAPGPVTTALNKRYWEKHSDPDWSVAVSEILAS